MQAIKWIKLTTTMFEDEKIDFIESLPESDAILVIWLKLLTLAGKCNAGGFILLTENIPYTVDMLAHRMRRPPNTVKMAIETLKQLGMVQSINDAFYITNWEKHQNIDALEKIRLQNRERKRKQRENEKLLLETLKEEKCHVTVTGQSQQGHATDIDIDIDKEYKELLSCSSNDDRIPYKDIVDYLNSKTGARYRPGTRVTKDCIKARWKEGFKMDDFKQVIDNMSAEWKDTKMAIYLRPVTLFGNKFESYLNREVKASMYENDELDGLFRKRG